MHDTYLLTDEESIGSGSPSVVCKPLRIPKTLSGSLWSQNYFYHNSKMLFSGSDGGKAMVGQTAVPLALRKVGTPGHACSHCICHCCARTAKKINIPDSFKNDLMKQ